MLGGLLLLLGTAPPASPAFPPVRAEAAEVPASAYRVRPGDTLSRVVERTGAGADAIARANRLAPPYRLRPGALLSIPPGRYHRVRGGETGIAIGHAYGLDWSAVATLNHLTPPFQLRAGDRLLLPSRDPGRPPTLEERAARFHVDLDDLVTGSAPALPRRQPRSAQRQAPPRAAIATPPAASPPTDPLPNTPPGSLRTGTARLTWPVAGQVLRRFGATAEGGRNDGLDLAATPGEPVRAAAAGTVVYAGAYPAFGQVILVTHEGGRVTIYARVGRPHVHRGEAVVAGQPLAPTAGPLHFELRQGRRPVDPLPLLGAHAPLPAPTHPVAPAKAGASGGAAPRPAIARPQLTPG